MSTPTYIKFKGARYVLADREAFIEETINIGVQDLAAVFEVVAKIMDGFGMTAAAQELRDSAADKDLLYNFIVNGNFQHEAKLAEIMFRMLKDLSRLATQLSDLKPRGPSETGHM
jgi:hypothetical protein